MAWQDFLKNAFSNYSVATGIAVIGFVCGIAQVNTPETHFWGNLAAWLFALPWMAGILWFFVFVGPIRTTILLIMFHPILMFFRSEEELERIFERQPVEAYSTGAMYFVWIQMLLVSGFMGAAAAADVLQLFAGHDSAYFAGENAIAWWHILGFGCVYGGTWCFRHFDEWMVPSMKIETHQPEYVV